jgi:Holliday junction resolvase
MPIVDSRGECKKEASNIYHERSKVLILLAGGQAAPNLLPVRHFQPQHVIILHTDFPKSEQGARNLKQRIDAPVVELVPIPAYEPGACTEAIRAILEKCPGALVNVTGGTKPMSMAALIASQQTGGQPFYVHSQQVQTVIDFYGFDDKGTPAIQATMTIQDTITIDDYLTVYFGESYQYTGYGGGPGEAFERAIHEVLAPPTSDEIKVGWKHNSGAVDVDLIVRCNNQIGVVEVKSGRKARTSEGIKQLAVAGGQRFFGTYVKRFLVVDQDWSDLSNNRALAEAIEINVIELPAYGHQGTVTAEEREAVVQAVVTNLGRIKRAGTTSGAAYETASM